MKFPLTGLTTLLVVASSCYAGTNQPTTSSIPPGPTQAVTKELGVVPEGIKLVVQNNASVQTESAGQGTIYTANVTRDVVDQHGNVLIPKGSSVDMMVRSVPTLGPGGAGSTELKLVIRQINIKGIWYPVESADAQKLGEPASNVMLTGQRIEVPAETELVFQTQGPIWLQGYID